MPKKPRESFMSIARRVNGISTPFGGVSWNPTEDKRDIVRRLVTRLEDKRVLYNDYHDEYGPWVEESVIEMRSILTEILQTCSDDDKLAEPIRAMRAACRKFLNDMGNPDISRLVFFQQDAMMWYNPHYS